MAHDTDPDWSLWRSFAAVVETGSLSAAARRLGLTQPTLGRHVEALEAVVGARLFDRTQQGLTPTDTALRLFEPVQQAQLALAEAMLRAEGAGSALEGTVRITSSEVTSHYVLPVLLGDLRETYPGIAIELASSNSVQNLLLREADIAVRMFRPTQLELIAKKVAVSPLCVCAHQNYLDHRGAPQSVAGLLDHDLIGFDRTDIIVNASRELGFPLKRDDFVLRTDSQTAAWEMLKAGLGIGFAQTVLVATTPGMVAILPEVSPPPLEVWLTTHRELFTSRRIRAIYDRLGETLSRVFAPPFQAPRSALSR
ncbi:MAG TPA: LysR family transcriptional regulator [Devosia sp.]|nr:LysR family transcriptional regulator [Devosia sp.]